MAKTAIKTQKQVQIIARITIKHSNLVVYKVRSSNGADTYQTTFLDGKVAGCSCPAYKPCYHMTQLQAREDERKQQEAEAMFRSLATSNAPKMSDAEANEYFLSLGKAEDARKQSVARLSREAYQDEFSPCTIPGMY